MRTNPMSPLWLVFCLALAAGCSSSNDSVGVAESASECAEEPSVGEVISRSPPDPRALPGPPMAYEIVSPELGPLAEFPVVPLDVGHMCRAGGDCKSGHCYDGVCCAGACGDLCEACNLPGNIGFCTLHPAGTNPENECGSPGCYDERQEIFSCDGAGSCQVQVESCRPYACGETACFDDCRDSADCAAGAQCVAEQCVQVGTQS